LKLLLIHIVFLYFVQVGLAQQKDSVLKLYKTYPVTATDFTVDQMGNLYVVTPTMQLKKINAKGDSLAVYNLSKRYGKLTSIDVSNPLKVLLYYQDYTTIITVDRLLTVTNTIDLRKQNIYQVKALATSYDSQFWFYDEQEAKLKKINDKGKITQQSVDLRQLLTSLPTPQKIIDNDNLVYVYDNKKGVFVFDYYGALKTTIPLIGWNSVHAYDKTIYGLKKDTLQKYTIGIPITKEIPLQKGAIPQKMVVATNKIYFLHTNEIKAYYNQ
jgi:hypothetical protein